MKPNMPDVLAMSTIARLAEQEEKGKRETQRIVAEAMLRVNFTETSGAMINDHGEPASKDDIAKLAAETHMVIMEHAKAALEAQERQKESRQQFLDAIKKANDDIAAPFRKARAERAERKRATGQWTIVNDSAKAEKAQP